MRLLDKGGSCLLAPPSRRSAIAGAGSCTYTRQAQFSTSRYPKHALKAQPEKKPPIHKANVMAAAVASRAEEAAVEEEVRLGAALASF